MAESNASLPKPSNTQRLAAKAASKYIAAKNKFFKPPHVCVEQYGTRTIAWEDMLPLLQSGDILLEGGNYPLCDFVRAQFQSKTSHSSVVWRNPEDQSLHEITSMARGHMPPVFEGASKLMKCHNCGIQHDGTQIHPLQPFHDATNSLIGNWLLWRPLYRVESDDGESNLEFSDAKSEIDEKEEEFTPLEQELIERRVCPSQSSNDSTVSAKMLESLQAICASPFPSPDEMYRRKYAVAALNKLQSKPKVGRAESIHCTEMVARALIDSGVLGKTIPGKKEQMPVYAVSNHHLEDGGLLERGWMGKGWEYGQEIWVRAPVHSMFNKDGSPRA
jgi:hypothetical protein